MVDVRAHTPPRTLKAKNILHRLIQRGQSNPNSEILNAVHRVQTEIIFFISSNRLERSTRCIFVLRIVAIWPNTY